MIERGVKKSYQKVYLLIASCITYKITQIAYICKVFL